MTWQGKLVLWENDKIQPMTHPAIDRAYAEGRLKIGRRLIKHLKLDLKGKKVLDVAVGSGGILCAFAEKGAKCYGIDVNDYFLEISKARFKDLKLNYKSIKKWDGKVIPFKDNEFDFVICTDTLEHCPDWKNFTKEICRVLHLRGKIFFSTERRWFPYFIYKSPHDDLPIIWLLPRGARAWIERRIHHPALDYHLFSWSSEIKKEFRKHNVIMTNFDCLKKERFYETEFPRFLWPVYNLMFIHLMGEKI